MKKKHKIGIISYYNLNKLDNGGKIRNHNIAKELAKSGHLVYVLMPSDQFKNKRKTQIYSTIEVNIKNKNHLSKITNLSKTGINYFKKNKIDIIIAEHAWTLLIGIILSQQLKIPLILDEHNIEFLRAKELGKIIRFIYAFILEKLLIHFCNSISFVSSIEKSAFQKNTRFRKHCIVVPNGSSIIPKKSDFLSYSKFNKVIKTKYKIKNKKILALFVGDLSYLPNADAVNILNDIAGAVSSFVQFLIVGKNESLNKNKLKNLLFTGYVDNLTEFLYGCDITILPMISGGGTNLKVLEAFTVGLPILCTKYALRGIELKDQNNVIISEKFDKYPNILQTFFAKKNMGLIQRYIDNSRHWRNSIESLNNLLDKYY